MRVLYLTLTFSFVALARSKALQLAYPIVRLDAATVTGVNNGSLNKFLGIPFAQAPRFDLPKAVTPYKGRINASTYGPSCPQQLTTPSPLLPVTLPQATSESEDCLSLNVYVPSGTKPSSNLPVAVIGTTESSDDTIARIVERSSVLNLPMIQVSMNYRYLIFSFVTCQEYSEGLRRISGKLYDKEYLSVCVYSHTITTAYGFLAGKEISSRKLGNIGLFDQRLALEWVQKYIGSFGGDPSKVVVYGSSAGAMSVNLQMLAFGGRTQNLFRGAFMQSGGPLPVGQINEGQVYYDAVVQNTGCASSNDSLQCLREVPFETLKAAVDKTPNIFSYSSAKIVWLPLVDGVFLQESPYSQIKAGKIPNIPVVSGNSDDEGTIFSFPQSNVTTEADFRNYIKTIWFPTASDAQLSPLWTNYTSDPSEGSPFGTGDLNQLYPQFKRLAAFQGDIIFQAPRRFFLKNLSGKQKKWSYLSKLFKSTPLVGSFHGTESVSNFLDDSFINFVSKLDPNTGSAPTWPQYSSESPVLMTFNDTGVRYLSQDTYRASAMECLTNLVIAHPM
ncbi:hypothetical protein CVT25_005259 [Psilocybe cyanescens]|uniref:Carboxylic ester hydrolase n=1 Tax=Psilocybe cyanescens TaxID=93625 RepID=A0A409WX14_PSICY|nr:hypothetical protein CVT25_005259 [Psilocybe cyanescens]